MTTAFEELQKLWGNPRAFTQWTEYRNELTSLLIKETRPGSNLLIIGAGKCDDFDLAALSSHFSEICLMDKDVDSMNEGLANQGIDERLPVYDYDDWEDYYERPEENCPAECLVHLIRADFMGISDDEYDEFCNKVTRFIREGNTDIDDMAEFAVSLMDKLYEKVVLCRKPLDNVTFDNIVCVGFHSQLNNVFPAIWDLYCNALGMTSEEVYIAAAEFNDKFIPKLNEQIIKAAKEKVFIGLERKRIGTIKSEVYGSAIEGAYQAMNDMDRRAETEPQKFFVHSLIWPYDLEMNIFYDMALYESTRD